MDAERAHDVATAGARALVSLPPLRALWTRLHTHESERLAVTLAGLRAAAPLGAAAGIDKRGDLYPALVACGFAHVESGTFTALAQSGNARPRLHRLESDEAIVNRMGFNNPGCEAAAARVARQRRSVPRGISLGKSRLAADAVADLAQSLAALAPLADYLAINVSSPNTPGVRDLQAEGALRALVDTARAAAPTTPIFVKLSPDLAVATFDHLLEVARELAVAAIVLTNTTLSREGLVDPRAATLEGGLSGAPLRPRSLAWVRRAFRRTEGALPIVGVGGVFSAADAEALLRAGATWLQAYTGFVYRGPSLARHVHRGLDRKLEREGARLEQWIGSHA
jgi:dihydroorotate dehydrogenase